MSTCMFVYVSTQHIQTSLQGKDKRGNYTRPACRVDIVFVCCHSRDACGVDIALVCCHSRDVESPLEATFGGATSGLLKACWIVVTEVLARSGEF